MWDLPRSGTEPASPGLTGIFFTPEPPVKPPACFWNVSPHYELWCWRRLLRVPWTARRSNQSILKEISPGCSLEAETPILWPPDVKSWLIGKDPDAGKNWGQEEKGMTEDEMVGWHHRLNGHGFGWTLGVGNGQGGLVYCGSWGRKESTWLSDWTEPNTLTWSLHPSLVIILGWLHLHHQPRFSSHEWATSVLAQSRPLLGVDWKLCLPLGQGAPHNQQIPSRTCPEPISPFSVMSVIGIIIYTTTGPETPENFYLLLGESDILLGGLLEE